MKKSKKKWLVENLRSYGSAIFLVLVIRSSVVESFKIPTGSMIPTLMVGDYLFVNKFAYGFKLPFSDWIADKPLMLVERQPPKRGDIIVFMYPGDESVHYIKRVIGVPGDKIRVQDKTVFINSKPLAREQVSHPNIISSLKDREYLEANLVLYDEANPSTNEKHLTMNDRSNPLFRDFDEVTVPAEHLFVMGDNRDFSSDSRVWGFVPYRNVRGQAMFVWFSLWLDFEKELYYFRPQRIGTVLK